MELYLHDYALLWYDALIIALTPITGIKKGSSARWPCAQRLEARMLLSAADPTAVEQYMLELINRARANPAAQAAALGIDLNEGLAVGTISADPKQPLAFNPALIAAARSHTSWMLQNDTFSHSEASLDPGGQMRSAGYPFAGPSGWGQNIAYRGSTPDVPPLVPTVTQEQTDLFLDSNEPGRGHRLNLLDPAFTEVGLGIAPGAFQGYNAVLVTQDFAYQTGSSFLTGVAYSDAIVHDHFYTPGEGLGGITITATRESDHAAFSTTTWAAGGYTLPLAPGRYTVTASGNSLEAQTFSDVVIGSQNVEVDFTPASAASSPPHSAPSSGSGVVFGTVFRDSNGNGIHDRGEGALPHVRVYADLNSDGVWERNEPSALSNGRGQFHLQLPSGSYILRQALPGRFVCTTPPGGTLQINASAGQSVTGIQFGDRLAPRKPRHGHSSISGS